MSQIKKGALLSYISIFLTNIIGLILTPFIIRSLGSSEYGLYTLIGSLVAYFTLIDFGLGDTVIRYVAMYKAQNDKKEEGIFLGITLRLYLIITAILLIAGLLIYFNLDEIFKNSLTTTELDQAHVLFAILLFNLAISLPGNIFLGVINAYERYTYSKGIFIIKYIFRSLLIVVVLFFDGKAVSIVLIDTIVNILFISFHLFYILKFMNIKIIFNKFKFSDVKNILSFSIFMFVLGIVSQFQWQGGQIMLGIISDTTTVAVYSVGVLLGTYYGGFSAAITSLFLPRATQMVVNNVAPEIIMETMIKVGRISVLVLLLILGAFFLFGKEFVLLWVGKEYSKSWTVALIIMLVYTIPLSQTFAGSLMEANKKVYYKAIVYTLTIGFGTLLGYFSFNKYGIIGIISSVSSFWFIGIIIMNIFYIKVLKLNIYLFFKVVFFKSTLLLVAILLVSSLLNFIPLTGWLGFATKCFFYTFIYFTIMYLFFMNSEEKSHIPKLI
jgi:O-antigen/teichoic acid export membrane protein